MIIRGFGCSSACRYLEVHDHPWIWVFCSIQEFRGSKSSVDLGVLLHAGIQRFMIIRKFGCSAACRNSVVHDQPGIWVLCSMQEFIGSKIQLFLGRHYGRKLV